MIEIPVAADVKRGDVDCTFKTKSLAVSIKERPLLEGPLYQSISPDDCSWELGPRFERYSTMRYRILSQMAKARAGC